MCKNLVLTTLDPLPQGVLKKIESLGFITWMPTICKLV